MSTFTISESTRKGAILASYRAKKMAIIGRLIILALLISILVGFIWLTLNQTTPNFTDKQRNDLILLVFVGSVFFFIIIGNLLNPLWFIKKPTTEEIKNYLLREQESIKKEIKETEDYLGKLKESRRNLALEIAKNWEDAGEENDLKN
ncbi:MAG: hypothetical protein KBD14_00425 [Candidatus Pacebacteria bacterium]|nr:hypothetical protein [Candidatus Paceibacterota bacterium]